MSCNVVGEAIEAAVHVAGARTGRFAGATEGTDRAHRNVAAGQWQIGAVPVIVGLYAAAVEVALHIVPELRGRILR